MNDGSLVDILLYAIMALIFVGLVLFGIRRLCCSRSQNVASSSSTSSSGYEAISLTVDHGLDPEELEFKDILERTVAASRRSGKDLDLDFDENDLNSSRLDHRDRAIMAKLGLDGVDDDDGLDLASGKTTSSATRSIQNSSSASFQSVKNNLEAHGAFSISMSDDDEDDEEQEDSRRKHQPKPSQPVSDPAIPNSSSLTSQTSRKTAKELLAEYDEDENYTETKFSSHPSHSEFDPRLLPPPPSDVSAVANSS